MPLSWEGEMADQDTPRTYTSVAEIDRIAKEFADALDLAFRRAGITNTVAARRVGVSARKVGN